MWKFQNFSITHILREINFEESRTSKRFFFCNFESSEFCQFGEFQHLKSAKIHENQNQELINVLQ